MPEQIDMKSINEGLALMLAQELHSYCLEAEQRFNDQGGEFFSSIQSRRVVEIGKSLNAIGEWHLMSAVFNVLPGYSQTWASRLWSSIGSWQDYTKE